MIVGYALAGCFAALSAIANAQDPSDNVLENVDTPFTFTDCAAPSEMETCWNAKNVTSSFDAEVDNCPNLEGRIQCALTNCWNRVYSCDYQQLMLSYNGTCSDEDVAPTLPFFPPPENAAGQCNCNLDNYVNALDKISGGMLSCVDKWNTDHMVSQDDDEDEDYPDCSCCYYGAVAAAMYDVCPDTNPNLLGLAEIETLYVDGGDYGNKTIQQCTDRLNNFSCSNNGFEAYGNNVTDYAKSTPIHSATGTFSDMSGIITSPVSGATYTWTAINSTFTITAASVEAVATKTASTSGSASGKASGSAASTASGSASTGAAATLGPVQRPAAALMGLSGLALAFL